jgi:hypothetical protein
MMLQEPFIINTLAHEGRNPSNTKHWQTKQKNYMNNITNQFTSREESSFKI